MENTLYDFGMIGLGVMGSNFLLNMADNGYKVIGFDLDAAKTKKLEEEATPGTMVKGVITLEELVKQLDKPRRIMMLVPAGKPVDAVIENLLPLIEKDDVIIDGGNSHYVDTLKRVQSLEEKGIHFMGMGVSGGEEGARKGPSIMPGGDLAAWKRVQPMLEAVSAKVDKEPCVAYMGKGAAGHYVKMVHNGIEYAMMQMISEVYDLLHRAGGYSNEHLHLLFQKWNEGQLQSFLIEITAEVFKTGDSDTPGNEDFLIDNILDQAGSKGTGKWTSQEAMDLPVAIPTIDMAVAMRDLSVYKAQRVNAAKLYQSTVNKTTITESNLLDLENAMAFCFAIAYAQGLSMLAKASEVHEMNIPLPDVIKVWKAGCIIRSALLGNFTNAYKKNPTLANLLLDDEIATLLKNRETSVRRILSLAINAKVPVTAMASALGYYDAYLSDRLPTNLIQAQRDYFGAHTYQRIDKEGVFHTEWHVEGS